MNIDSSYFDVLKLGGIAATLVMSIITLVMLFSRRYVAKDREHNDLNKKLITNFMEFIERKDAQSSVTNAEYLATIRLMQQEIEKASGFMRDFVKQLQDSNAILKVQAENLRIHNNKISNFEIVILEMKTQLNEVLFLIKKNAIKDESD